MQQSCSVNFSRDKDQWWLKVILHNQLVNAQEEPVKISYELTLPVIPGPVQHAMEFSEFRICDSWQNATHSQAQEDGKIFVEKHSILQNPLNKLHLIFMLQRLFASCQEQYLELTRK